MKNFCIKCNGTSEFKLYINWFNYYRKTETSRKYAGDTRNYYYGIDKAGKTFCGSRKVKAITTTEFFNLINHPKTYELW